jgi:hypothetical protein
MAAQFEASPIGIPYGIGGKAAGGNREAVLCNVTAKIRTAARTCRHPIPDCRTRPDIAGPSAFDHGNLQAKRGTNNMRPTKPPTVQYATDRPATAAPLAMTAALI